MSLSAQQINQLEKIIAAATELLKSAIAASEKGSEKAAGPHKRRAGNELAAFRKMLAFERANGVAAADLARGCMACRPLASIQSRRPGRALQRSLWQ